MNVRDVGKISHLGSNLVYGLVLLYSPASGLFSSTVTCLEERQYSLFMKETIRMDVKDTEAALAELVACC